MDSREKLEKIDDFFNNLTIGEFDKILVDEIGRASCRERV